VRRVRSIFGSTGHFRDTSAAITLIALAFTPRKTAHSGQRCQGAERGEGGVVRVGASPRRAAPKIRFGFGFRGGQPPLATASWAANSD
jgi:hypothetical protein